MRALMIVLSLFLLTACSLQSKTALKHRVKVNGLICPEGYSQPAVDKDLKECHYYDEKKAAEASESPLKPDCAKCLEEKGYEIE